MEGREEMGNLGCPTGSTQCSPDICCPTGTCPTGTTCPYSTQVIVDGCCVNACRPGWSECYLCGSPPYQQPCAQLCSGDNHERCCDSDQMYNPDTGTCSAPTCSSTQFLCKDGYCCANPNGCQGPSGEFCCADQSPPNTEGICSCQIGSTQCSPGICCPTGTCPTGTTCPDSSQVIVDGCCVSSCPAGQCKGSSTYCCLDSSSPPVTTCPACTSEQMLNTDGCCVNKCNTGQCLSPTSKCCPDSSSSGGTTCAPCSNLQQYDNNECCVNKCLTGQCLGKAGSCCPDSSSSGGTTCATCPTDQFIGPDGCCQFHCTGEMISCLDGCCNNACNSSGYCCAATGMLVNGECQCPNGDVCAQECVGQSCCRPGWTLYEGACECTTLKNKDNIVCGTVDCCIKGGCCGNIKCLPTYVPNTSNNLTGSNNVIGFVTQEGSIIAVNLASNSISDTVIEAEGLVLSMYNNNYVYALGTDSNGDSNIGKINIDTGKIEKSLSGLKYVVDMAITSDGTYIYALGNGPYDSNIIYWVDAAAMTLLHATIPRIATIEADTIKLSPNDQYFFINPRNDQSPGLSQCILDKSVVMVFSTSVGGVVKMQLAATIETPNQIAQNYAFTSDNKTAYILVNTFENSSITPYPCQWTGSAILVIDLLNLTPVTTPVRNISLDGSLCTYASGMEISVDNQYLYVTVLDGDGGVNDAGINKLITVDLNTNISQPNPPQIGTDKFRYAPQRLQKTDDAKSLYIPQGNILFQNDLNTSVITPLPGFSNIQNMCKTNPPFSSDGCCNNFVYDFGDDSGQCCGSNTEGTWCWHSQADIPPNLPAGASTQVGSCCVSDCCPSASCCFDQTQPTPVPKGCIPPGDRCCYNGTMIAATACCPEDPTCGITPGTSGTCCCGSVLQTAADGLCCNNTWHPTTTEPGICCAGLNSGDPSTWNPSPDNICCAGKGVESSKGVCCGNTWNPNNSDGSPSGVCCNNVWYANGAGICCDNVWVGGADLNCCSNSDCTSQYFTTCKSNQCNSCCGDMDNWVCCPFTGHYCNPCFDRVLDPKCSGSC